VIYVYILVLVYFQDFCNVVHFSLFSMLEQFHIKTVICEHNLPEALLQILCIKNIAVISKNEIHIMFIVVYQKGRHIKSLLVLSLWRAREGVG
jgi:hypothetical protein